MVCWGTRAEVHSKKESDAVKSFSKSKEPVYCASLRSDGKLLAIGNSIGKILVFDYDSKLLLRTLEGHKSIVRNLKFLPNKVNLISSSDDGTIRLWDIAEGSEIACFSDSQDYVRTLSVCDSSSSLFLSGSYDGFVRLYDAQKKELILSLNHGSPVEAVVLASDGRIAISAGGNVVKIWDLIAGGQLLQSLVPHQKTISSLWTSCDGRFLLTGSLDHHVKVIDLTSYKVIHSWSFSSAVISIALNGRLLDCLSVGLSNGSLVMKIRKAEVEQVQIDNSNITKLELNNNKNGPNSYITRLLKRFQYRSAFIKALETSDAYLVASVIDELNRRNGIEASLSGLSHDGLLKLLAMASKSVGNPRLCSSFMLLLDRIIKMNLSDGKSVSEPGIINALMKILNTANIELGLQNNLKAMKGMLDLIQTSQTISEYSRIDLD